MTVQPPNTNIETELLRAIRIFFEERAARPTLAENPEEVLSGRPLQLATTVLFLQMINADHESKHDEHAALVAAVARVLEVDAEGATFIIRTAEEHIRTPLPKLLRLLTERCTTSQKKRVVECMWQLAFADAELAGHEEYFVRKVAESIGLQTADLIEAKILAREAFLSSGG
ncbi:MAG: TerB family tellurite resistance protein [Vicinamibacteria bacterium]|nr:TerB family tellurite resistance protein [Vicinamibacteria bacterium]